MTKAYIIIAMVYWYLISMYTRSIIMGGLLPMFSKLWNPYLIFGIYNIHNRTFEHIEYYFAPTFAHKWLSYHGYGENLGTPCDV